MPESDFYRVGSLQDVLKKVKSLTPDSFLITGKNPVFARKLEELTWQPSFFIQAGSSRPFGAQDFGWITTKILANFLVKTPD